MNKNVSKNQYKMENNIEVSLLDSYTWLFGYLFKCDFVSNVILHDVKKALRRTAIDFQSYVSKTAPSGIWNKGVIEYHNLINRALKSHVAILFLLLILLLSACNGKTISKESRDDT